METTTNYSLNMPSQEDFYNIDDINENMETIDAVMYELEQGTSGVAEKIGSSDDAGGSETAGTVMAKLNTVQAKLAGIKPEYEYTNTITADLVIYNTYTEDAPYSYTGSGIFKIKKTRNEYIYLKIDNGSWLTGDNFPDDTFLKFNTSIQAYGGSNALSYSSKLTVLV
jgi:hypothetical protein